MMFNWIKKILPITETGPASAEMIAEANELYGMGKIAYKDGALPKAIQYFTKALDAHPDFEEAYRDLCLALFQAGQPAKAKAVVLKGLSRFPNSTELSLYLGNLYFENGEYVNASGRYQQVLDIQPHHGMAHFNLGRVQQELGETNAAIGSYRRALAAEPGLVSAHLNLGSLLEARHDVDAALACYRKALAIKPDCKGVHNNIGHTLMAQGKLDEALVALRKELSINPDLPEAHNNMGAVFRAQGKLEKAIECFEKAIESDPDNIAGHQNLASSYSAQRNLEQALLHCRKALELDPDFAPGRALLVHLLQHTCQWDELVPNIEALRKIVSNPMPSSDNQVAPFTLLSLSGVGAAEQRRCAEQFARGEFEILRRRSQELAFSFNASGDRKIHVGYLSADSHQHATAVLMAEVFELHDHDRFRISAYSCGADDRSPMRRRLERAFDRFVDIRKLSDEEAARKINSDRVDILVDLKGYTDGSRSSILALRPAPIQVNYLGYPGTMGADFVDYLIADSFVIPKEHVDRYTEKVVWLDDCYQPNDRKRALPAAPSRIECNLPEQGIVFCCFNQTYKITSEVFDIWCRLLKAIPESVLWLLASNPHAEENLRREMKRRGVAPDRLIMAPPTSPEQHLARLQCADLFLDTLPYNAHTTCSDALWMGLPVVTCVGDTFPSRVAGSLLTAMETPELITYDLEEYWSVAAALAADETRREELRRRLIDKRNTAVLFDSARFTRNLERVYDRMRDEMRAPEKSLGQ
jgi:predicted O-linked N-acetylglucosamine transferase (SPINDLY family)